MKAIKTDKDILDKIENNEIVNVDSISSDDLFKIIKDIEPYKGLDIPNIKETDKIVITPVSCLNGPKESLIIKKDEYPQFDDLLSKLIIDDDSYCTSYIIIELYKGTKLIVKGYLYDLDSIEEEKMLEAIKQAKEWLKQKQKL